MDFIKLNEKYVKWLWLQTRISMEYFVYFLFFEFLFFLLVWYNWLFKVSFNLKKSEVHSILLHFGKNREERKVFIFLFIRKVYFYIPVNLKEQLRGKIIAAAYQV